MLNTFRLPRRCAGWWSAILLGALLAMPAELARADEADRGERAASSRASSGSRSSGSSAKASSPSRSASRSAPRASSSSRPSRSQPRAQARSQPTRRSGGAERHRGIKHEGARPDRRSAPPKAESARPVGRTEIPTPRVAPRGRNNPAPPKVENGPVDRTEISVPRRRFTRPRYQTPAERSPDGRSAKRPNATVERRRPADAGDWKRHYEIDEVAPSDPSTAPPARRRGYRDGRGHGGHHGGRYGGHHHRHHYGCGHYGYGDRYYDPFDYYGFGYYSPYFYLGLGGSYVSEVHVYGGGGGGGSERYRDVGQGALDLDLRPGSAEIYIDGTYVGVADQFDGFPTYLWLDAGTYEIAFYKEGYETIFRQYTIYPGVTIDVDDRMRPGEAISPIAPAYPSAGEPPASFPSSEARPPVAASVPFGDDGGRVAIAATPGDAAVYLDGHFVGTAAELSELGAGLIVEPGDHVVDVIRPGYDNQRVPVSVAAGERIDLKLDLKRP